MTAAVVNGDVRLATTDFGGQGPSIVLMHGLGDNRGAMSRVASELDGWRVITMDLRGHGKSTTARWDFPQVIADLDAVIRSYELESPYVGGHSLGGMIALQYALTGRPVSGAINIDGWGPGIAGRYLGEDTTLVTEHLDRVGRGELPSRAARLLSAVTRQSREGTTRQVLRLLHGADVVGWHRDVPCPSLAVNATAPSRKAVSCLMGREATRLQDSHRRGLRRDLAALAHDRPLVKVVDVDATHALIRTHPERVASAIRDFRANLESRRA
jgi:pimeloyl-ACP methyl ester carboxylesterase